MKNQDLVNYLRECGVCLFCQLRYLKARGNEYQNRRQYLEKVYMYVSIYNNSKLILFQL